MKKGLLLIALAMIILFSFVGCSSQLGVINGTISKINSSSSSVTFYGKDGQNIEVKYTSSVKEGTLILNLTDNDGVIVETFEAGVSSSKTIRLSKDDKYILSVTYENFTGSYQIKALES